MNTLPNDTMTERALQQMRDTVASTAVPILPAGPPPVAAAPSQPTETKPAETENAAPQGERSEETTTPSQPNETPSTATEPEPDTNTPAPAAIPAGEGQPVSPARSENPWGEAAAKRLANQQLGRLFNRGNGTDSTLFSSRQPAGGGQVPMAAPVQPLHPAEEAAQPSRQPAEGRQPIRQEESMRVAKSGYGDVQPYVDRMDNERQDTDAILQKVEQTDSEIDRENEDYRKAAGNPLADIVLEKQKPESDEKKKKRLKLAQKLIALNNIFAAIGQGIGGISVGAVDNDSLGYIRGQLQRLDDLYRNEKNRYDQNELLAAMRKDKAVQEAAKQKIDTATKRRKHYADRYDKAVEGNRDIAKKRAELEVKASEFSQEQAYKQEALKETERHNRANESLQSRRIEKEHPKIKVRNHSTGEYDDLTPERRADIAGVIDLITDQRESAKKGPFGEWIAGKTPNPMNNELTDEELNDLRNAMKNGKLTPTQEGLVSRLYNRMVSGGFYDPEAEHPYGVAPKPTSGYAQSNHKQYVDYVRTMHDWMIRTEQIENNKITIEHAKQLFDGLKMAPANAVKQVLQEAGFRVID